MSTNYFFKVWIEILDDPKMGLISDKLYRRTIECFALAAELYQNGLLPDVKKMAWRLRLTSKELVEDLTELEALKIVHFADGNWYVTNWEKRQAAVPPGERMRQYRKRLRDGYGGITGPLRSGYEPGYDYVTNRNRDRDRDREEEQLSSSSETTKNPPNGNLPDSEWEPEIDVVFAEACQTYEKEIGPLTPTIAEQIEDWLKLYPLQWVTDAMETAAKAGKRNAKYTNGILKNWYTDGRDDAKSAAPKEQKDVDAALEEAGYERN